MTATIAYSRTPDRPETARVSLQKDGVEVEYFLLDQAYEAVAAAAALPGVKTAIDVGAGEGTQARILRHVGIEVTTLDPVFPSDVNADVFDPEVGELGPYDLVFTSHVIEHQRNVGLFVDRLIQLCKPGGWLVITAPPEITPAFLLAHPFQFTAGSIMYHLVMAGVDCRNARALTYAYNVSVIVQNNPNGLPKQSWAHEGECERFFPEPLRRFSPTQIWGPIRELNWKPVLPGVEPHPNAQLT